MKVVPPIRRARAQSRIKLNIGPGGRFKKDGWLTLDHYLANADYHLDLREAPRLPFPDSSVDRIFCSHVIEHLDDRAVESLFRESFRVLRGDGLLRISCPDVETAIAQHRAGLCDPEGEVLTSTMKSAPSHLRLLNVFCSFQAPSYEGIVNFKNETVYSGGPHATPEEIEARLAKGSLQDFADWVHGLTPSDATYKAHINAFWPEKVARKLNEAGFAEVTRSTYRGSIDAELRGQAFDNRPNISLYYEARPRGFAKTLRGDANFLARVLKNAYSLWTSRDRTK